ncbi:hypothetical protein SLEP1_g4904 [Rubroshorea leprosula]|uniref:Uncharacterized protein n=1 Tax=Rubroshorea leprosula TaxID=152421 RepID=A0AAV5HWL1_9ROSI|nr:hypothetical protein SLEP1_g4904 [Rubroshorea leprosula]
MAKVKVLVKNMDKEWLTMLRLGAFSCDAGGEISQIVSSKKLALGKRKSVVQPPKSRACKATASLEKVIEWIKRLRLTHGGKCLGTQYYNLSVCFSSKFEEAKEVEALVMNIDELPAFRVGDVELVLRNPPTKESVDIAIAKKGTMDSKRSKGKVKAIAVVSKGKGRDAIEKTSFESSISSKDESTDSDKSFESENGFEQKGEDEGFYGNIDVNRTAPEELELDVGNALKKLVLSKNKMDIDKSTISAVKLVTSLSEVVHSGKPSLVPAKLSKIDNSAIKLLKDLNEMNEDRDVSLAQFGLVPTSDAQLVGKFEVHLMLETLICHLLKTVPELIVCNKVKKMMIEDAFANLCATMRQMEVTLFAEINVDSPLMMLRV